MFWLSLIVAALTLGVSLWGQGGFGTPLSTELASGNYVAYFLLVGLAAVIIMLSRRLVRKRSDVAAALLIGSILGLIIIALTEPESFVHCMAYYFLVAGTILWFAAMGVEYDDQFMLVGAGVAAVVVPMGCALSLGVSEKFYILYTLVSANLLYYSYLVPDGRRKSPPKRNPWDEYVV